MGDTHTHTHTDFPDKSNQVHAGLWLALAWLSNYMITLIIVVHKEICAEAVNAMYKDVHAMWKHCR